jgi:predicted exporter
VRSLLVVVGTSQEHVLRTGEQLRGHLAQWVANGEIGGFELASDYLPSAATQARRQAALPPPDQLRANLAEAVAGLPFQPDTFAPFLRAADEARQAPPLTMENLAGTAFGLKVGSLLRDDGGSWTMAVPLTGVNNPGIGNQSGGTPSSGCAMDRPARRIRVDDVGLAGAALRGVGLGTIYVVLAQGLRSARRAWRVIMPIGVALPLTAATLVGVGQPLSVFHLVALLLVMGIGINYALFFLRATEMRDRFPRTLQTLALVSGTTLCAFGALAFHVHRCCTRLA